MRLVQISLDNGKVVLNHLHIGRQYYDKILMDFSLRVIGIRGPS